MTEEVSSEFQDSRAGAFCTSGGMDLPDLWRVIHLSGRLAERAAAIVPNSDPGPAEDLHRAWSVHKRELASVPIGRWQGLCSAAGWTWLGAAASSWCLGAQLEQVWAAWRSCAAPLESGPAFHYAAHRMNPDLLGSRVDVSGQPIIRDETDDVMICVMLSVAPSRLVVQGGRGCGSG